MGNCAWFGSPVPIPTPWGATVAPLGLGHFELHPRHPLLLIPNGPFPPKTALGLRGPSCSHLFWMLQALPLHLLPFPSVLVFGAQQKIWAGKGGLVGFGGKQAFGVARVGFALPGLSPLCCVFGEGERLHALSSSCEANCVSQLVSKWCPQGAATWGATIWDFCSQPNALQSTAPAARGRFALLFHLEVLGFGQRVWLSAAGSAFGIFQLFPFPRSFANPKSLRLGCSSLLSKAILGIQQLVL